MSTTLSACGGGEKSTGPAAIASIQFSLPFASLLPGASQQLTAVAKAADGASLTDRTITWSSGNTTIATVSPSGLLTAVTPGTTTITAASGGQSANQSITVLPHPVSTITLNPSTPSIVAGTTVTIAATLLSASGAILTDRVVAWTTSSATIATVDASGVVTGVGPGTAQITATSETKSAIATITVTQAPVSTISVTVANSTLTVNATTTATAVLRDASNNVLTGRAISWNSTNVAVATVSATGAVTATGIGTTSIVATSEGKTGAASLTVAPPPVATVVVSPTNPIVVVGETQQFTAALTDTQGNAIAAGSRVVTWQSANTTVAAVNANGLVTTLAPGSAAITATSEGKSGSSTIIIAASVNSPVVTSISPSPLVPGTTATITGVRFGGSNNQNTVTVRGVSATVLTSSATQLTFTVPCVSSGNSNVLVTSTGLPSPAFELPVSVTARTLGIGQSVVVSNNNGSLCNELVTNSANARYLVAVFSSATSQNTLVNFEIAGNTPAAGVAARIVAPAASLAARSAESSPEAEHDTEHFRMLEKDRANFEKSMAKARRMGVNLTRTAVRNGEARSALTIPVPVLGELRDHFFTYNGGCDDVSVPMHTKAIYIGTRAIIWEDQNNGLLSSANAALAGFYQRLGQIFDQDQYATVRDFFGDPLLRDTQTDNDGRLHMVFSSRLNSTGAAAYVTSCDQFPKSINAGSNFGEYFYGQVPSVLGSNVNNTNYSDGWFYFMGRTIVHEVKHIASHAARVQNSAPVFESSWLEEGTARHAEEMWVRTYLHKVNWKANTGWTPASANGLYCDFHPADATCNALDELRRPSYGMRRQFNEIRNKLLSPWDWSPYGDGTGQSGSVFYQTSWSLVRYTIDRYAASDAAFFKALLNSSTNGVTNLAAVAGVPLDDLIGGWGLALFADDYPGMPTTNPDLQFPTWNLRSIYAGLNASPNWSSTYPTAFPIAPVQLSFGSFTSSRSGLRGGAHSYYEISGAVNANQLLQLRGLNGAAPSTNLRIAIARLQ